METYKKLYQEACTYKLQINKGRYQSLDPVVEISMQKLKARAKCRLENSAFVYTGKLKKIPHSLLM